MSLQIPAAATQNPSHESVPVEVKTTTSVVSSESTASTPLMPQEPPVFPPSADKGFDIIILSDAAAGRASAEYVRYRKEALKLFISLLSEDDRLAVLPFEKNTAAVSPLLQNILQNRPALFTEIDRSISSEPLEPLPAACRQVTGSSRRNRAVVLVSDKKTFGKDELAPLAAVLVSNHVKLYAIASSEDPLLASLVRETAGVLYSVGSANELHLALAAVYEKIKSPDSLPVAGDSFGIDSNVREMTVVISKNPGTTAAMTGPAGVQESSAKHALQTVWTSAQAYDLVVIQNPQPGQWRAAMGRNGQTKVYLRTDLRLEALLDRATLRAGDTARIDAWFEKKGELVTNPGTLDLASFSGSVEGPDGKKSTLSLAPASHPAFGACRSGVYSGSLSVDGEGEYVVKVSAAGRSFLREKALVLSVAAISEHAHQTNAFAAGGVPWVSVLVKFVLINIAIAVLIGVFFITKTLKLKMSSARKKE